MLFKRDKGSPRQPLPGQTTSDKCVLVVGFEEPEEWRLQLNWSRAGLTLPLRFVSDWKNQIATRVLAAHRRWKPDLILFSAGSPDGLELLRWTRAQPSMREAIVVGCVEDCADNNVKLALKLGVDCCIMKSNDFHEVIQLIRRVEAYWHPSRSQEAA